MSNSKKTPPKKPARKPTRKAALLRGGHAIEAIGRAIRKCQAEGDSPLRVPLPEARFETFCLALFTEPTVGAAAIAAGYSTATARQQGSRLLTGRVDIRRRVYGLYETTFRSHKRLVLEKGDALARSTERHAARRAIAIPAWRLVGKTADEVGAELERLAEEGHDVSLIEPVMRLTREEVPMLNEDGHPLKGPTGAPVTRQTYVARCESVKLPDEQGEEKHLSALLGWMPPPDGSGDRELDRLRGTVQQFVPEADDTPEPGAPVILVPDDGAPFPEG